MRATHKGKTAGSAPRKARRNEKVEWVAPKDPETGKNLEPWMLQEAISRKRVKESLFQLSRRFIEDCRVVGTARLTQGMRSEMAGFYMADLADALAECIEELVRAGDVFLARKLPQAVKRLNSALQVYGDTVTGTHHEQLTIARLLEQEKPHALLAMLSARHRDWPLSVFILGRGWVRERTEALAEQGKTRAKRSRLLKKLRAAEAKAYQHARALEQLPEAELRDALLNPKAQGRRKLVKLIEQVWLASGQGIGKGRRKITVASARINIFTELLFQGWFWNGGQFKQCPWWKKADNPPRHKTKEWLAKALPFLESETKGDAAKLTVFSHLLATRKAVKRPGQPADGIARLADGQSGVVWSQVRTELDKSWERMAGQARKSKSGA